MRKHLFRFSVPQRKYCAENRPRIADMLVIALIGKAKPHSGILGGQTLTWFSPSGWSLVSNSWQNTFNCSATTSASTVLYRNGIFCAFVTTWASYNPNRVQGLQNGTLLGTWNDSVFGSVCVNLLRFRMQLTRTQN